MAENNFPFRRMTDPLMLPVGTTSQNTVVPDGFIPAGATSFLAVNRNSFWVRLKGFTGANAAAGTIGASDGWLFPPGFWGVFSTQFPDAMATISIAAQGIAAGTGTLEISYGGGVGGVSTGFLPPPTTQAVTVGNFPATQPVSGSVAVSNFPATQTTIARGTGSMVTGQVNMAAQNTSYPVAAARAARRSITFVPTSQFTYYYGNSGVTTTTGAAAPNGSAVTLETTAAVYVVSPSTGIMTYVEHF